MLDAQRHKGATYRLDIHFTRWVLWTHLGLGALCVFLLLFHELFGWSAVAGGWYLLTVLLVYGISSGPEFCRPLLGVVFLFFTVGGVYFLGQTLPLLKPETAPLIPHALLPFWLGFMNIAYAAGGLCLLLHPSVHKAAKVGFRLW